MITFVVTTALSAGDAERERARRLSDELGVPVVARANRSLQAIANAYGTDGVLVVSRRRTSLFVSGREFFFHPGMAILRIKALVAGKTDQMVKAMDLRPGDRVLDCTLGLGSDAIVAAHVVGDEGAVVGLEMVRPVAVLVRQGMEALQRSDDHWLAAAAGRVRVVEADHRTYLPQLPDKSFDVVYFDPMFRRGVAASSDMLPLRVLADRSPVDRETVAEAARVASKRVVVKERRLSTEFDRLGLTEIVGGRYAAVAYGIKRTGGDAV